MQVLQNILKCRSCDPQSLNQIQFELKEPRKVVGGDKSVRKEWKIKRTIGKSAYSQNIASKSMIVNSTLTCSGLPTQSQIPQRMIKGTEIQKMHAVSRLTAGSLGKQQQRETSRFQCIPRSTAKSASNKEVISNESFGLSHFEKLDQSTPNLTKRKAPNLKFINIHQIPQTLNLPKKIIAIPQKTQRFQRNASFQISSPNQNLINSTNYEMTSHSQHSNLMINETDCMSLSKLHCDLIMLSKELNSLEKQELNLEEQRKFSRHKIELSLLKIQKIRADLQEKAQARQKEITEVQKMIKQFCDKKQMHA